MDSKHVCTFNSNLNHYEQISPIISNKNQLFHAYNDKTLSCVKAGDFGQNVDLFQIDSKNKTISKLTINVKNLDVFIRFDLMYISFLKLLYNYGLFRCST